MAIGSLYFISITVIDLPYVRNTIFGLHCRGSSMSSLQFKAAERNEHVYGIVLRSVSLPCGHRSNYLDHWVIYLHRAVGTSVLDAWMFAHVYCLVISSNSFATAADPFDKPAEIPRAAQPVLRAAAQAFESDTACFRRRLLDMFRRRNLFGKSLFAYLQAAQPVLRLAFQVFEDGTTCLEIILLAFYGGIACFGSCVLDTLRRHNLFPDLFLEHFKAA